MDNIRICCTCGEPMSSGYCIGDGELYYCSDKCLHEIFSEAEYQGMHERGNAYWTDWGSVYEEEPPTHLTVCYKQPNQPIQVREIPNTIGSLQYLVDGYVEVARGWRKGVVILCDEEGLIKNKQPNCLGLVGSIVFVGTRRSAFRSLTEEEILAIKEWDDEANRE